MIDAPATASLLTRATPEADVARGGGGKALNLHRLAATGVAVPEWAALGTDVFDAFLAATGVGDRIDAALADVDAAGVEAAAAAVERAFAEAAVGPETVVLVERAYAHVGGGAVAVRSSALGEDSSRLSFAGQHATFLNESGLDAVVDRVRACWASAYSARALEYRRLHDLPLSGIRIAVIVQAMVAADVAGVAFTLNPVSGRDDELMISAAYGLGEGLVSGRVDGDTILVERATRRVKHEVIGEKAERFDGAGEPSAVPEQDRRRLAVEPGQIDAIVAAALTIERHFGAPQDIEWAIADGRTWILQARPVTTRTGALRVWDNSNIIESYGEITAPLTFSFARHVYHRVYREHCRQLGIPERQIEQMDEWLENMLGCFDGRVYYNVLNWYKLMRAMPFHRVNRRILAATTGVRETSVELAEAQLPYELDSRLLAALIRARVAVRFAWMFATVERSAERFVADFTRVYERFEAADFSARGGDELYRAYVDFERTLLAPWGRMVMLDFVIGLSYGLLDSLGGRWLPEAPEWFKWQVVKVESGDVESTRPAERLTAIARELATRERLAELIESVDAREAYAALTRASDPDARWLRAEVDAYVADFGDRNVNELKLEEPDLRDDPSLIFAMLRDALAQLGHERAATPAHDADAFLDARLRGWRRRGYELVRAKVRRALRERERVRFARSRAFGMARRLLRAIGEDLERAGALASSRDVFYLRLDEIRGCFEGTIAHRELRPLVELRRAQEAEQRRLPPPPSRFLTRGDPYWGERRSDEQVAAADGSDRLSGTPCSPGVVVAEARVVDEPRDVGGRILVTYRTDPGWVGALSSASALLIERGSPLTHVAIVARELGIPTVVQIPGLTRRVESGMTLRVDGGEGTVDVVAEAR